MMQQDAEEDFAIASAGQRGWRRRRLLRFMFANNAGEDRIGDVQGLLLTRSTVRAVDGRPSECEQTLAQEAAILALYGALRNPTDLVHEPGLERGPPLRRIVRAGLQLGLPQHLRQRLRGCEP